VAAALRLASTAPGIRVATVACDTGTRYLSTDLFASE
jgi:cysteine synthase